MRLTRARIRIITAIYWIGIFTLTHIPANRLPETHVSDKLAHFMVFALLAAGLFFSMGQPGRIGTTVLVLAIALAYGAFDEITQPYFHRTCSIYDWYADAAGAATALIVLVLWGVRHA